MSTPVGVALPYKVYGCTIKNDSDDDVKVRISYERMPDEGENVHHEIIQMDIPANGEFRVHERFIDKDSHQIRQTIEAIEVIRLDGSTLQLREPFEGVVSPEVDWLFGIHNTKIESIQRNS